MPQDKSTIEAAKALYQQANDAYYDDEFAKSESLYTQAIAADSTCGEYYLKRAQVRHKLNKTEASISDSEKAAALTEGKSDQLREHFKALSLHGKWSFAAKKYNDAVESLTKAVKINPNDEATKELLSKAEKLATPPPPPPSQPETTASDETTAPAPTTAPARPKVRYEWYQNDNFITVEVFVKKVAKEALEVEITDSSLSLSIKLATGSENNMDFDPLLYKIIPSESKYEVLSTKIEIRLKKANAGQKWDYLELAEAQENEMKNSGGLASSRKGISWDQIAKDAEKETKLSADEQNVNELFQTIYKDADDDTRRAMMKSYIESNGTALSTDWKSVKEKTFETMPPNDCVAKPFNS